MAFFQDSFARPNGSVGNGWMVKNKSEGSAPVAWSIAGQRAIEDAGITTIMFRDHPVAVGASHKIEAHFVGKNSCELIFRYSATGGQGNRRYSVVITGATAKVVRRQWNGSATVELENYGSWARADDLDFNLRVDVTSDSFAVYDSNTADFATPILEVSGEETWNDATGIALGSGHCETFRITDLESYTASEYEFSRIGATPYADVMITFAEADDAEIEAVQHYATLDTEPYVILDGIPHGADTTLTVPAGIVLGSVTVDDSGAPVDPALVDTDADFRWLPQDYTPNATTWFPHNLPQPVRNWTINTQPAGEPYLDASYTYQGASGSVTRQAMVFNGKGFMQLNAYEEPDGYNRDFTIAVVAVLHGGAGKQYSIFQTDRSTYAPTADETQALSLQYAHGKYTVFAGGQRAAYERKAGPSRVSVMILSLNPAGVVTRGYVMIQDGRRMSSMFSLRDVEVYSPALFFGAAMSNYDQFTDETAANMDVLEIDMWDRALTPPEMRRFISQMSPLYDVVK